MTLPRAAAQRTKHIAQHLNPTHNPTMASRLSTPAPWRHDFQAHVEDMDEPSFTLTTLHQSSSSQTKKNPYSVVPRARTVIYRGMWAELPVNPKNPAELNPKGIYESDLPTITSDARMEKIPELFRTATSSGGSAGEQVQQSGSGGPVEAVFWASKARTQWRLRGHAYVVGPDIDSEAAAPVRTALQRYMRTSQDSSESSSTWSFGRELTAQFGNLSPMMRGTFRNPPPGTPLSETPRDGEGLGQKVEGVDDELARKNFRVVVIVPDEVDRVDLTDPERGRRWNYAYVGSADEGSWKTTELWP